MPPFLSTSEEAQANVTEIRVRYALSAFEDLNGTIRNLRRCFGFPYQEYIGYLNTLTRTHRVRREHEVLVDTLRRWAIFGNVDAVVWIDYAKANQPPGSFKMGPRDSRPFSAHHMDICDDVARYEYRGDDDDESAWSEVEEHDVLFGGGSAAATAHAAELVPGTAAAGDAGHRNSKAILQTFLRGRLTRGTEVAEGSAPEGSSAAALRRSVLHGRSREHGRASASTDEGRDGAVATGSSAPGPPERREPVVEATRRETGRPRPSPRSDDKSVFRSMLQEEFVPAHDSIYTRSISPGPGYYSVSDSSFDGGGGSRFGYRPQSSIDFAIAASKDKPGPGQYEVKESLADAKVHFGRFNRSEKLVQPMDVSRKLPFISAYASTLECHGVHSPAVFHSVSPETAPCMTRGFRRPPKYSFCKSRRPF